MKNFRLLPLVLAFAFSLSNLGCKTADSVSEHKDAQMDLTQPVLPSEQKLPKTAKVSFKNLKEGKKIRSGFLVKFDVKGMKVVPAGQLVSGTGHHHLIINGSFIERGQVIPADAQHIHFGKGQTDYQLNLAPGKYTLTLQFADGAHLSYGEQMSATVHVTVR